MTPYVRPAAVQPGDRTAGWSVFLLLLAVYTATFSGLPDVPDAEVEYQTTSSIVRDQRLALGGTPEAEALLAEGFGVAPGGPGRSGRVYSRYGVGQAVLAVPLYLAGRGLGLLWPSIELRHAQTKAFGHPRSEYFAHLLVGWRNPLLGALTGMLIVLTARRLGVRRRFAWACGLSYGLATFAWPQARSTLSDVQATFLLFGAYHLIVRARECFARLAPPAAPLLSGIGLLLGAALLTRIAVLPAVLVLVVTAWRVLDFGHKLLGRAWVGKELPQRQRLPTQALDLVLPLVVCVLVLLALNYVRFGGLLRTGYESSVDLASFVSRSPQLGLAGLLVSPGRGLLWMAPGLLLLPVALRHAHRSGERLWWGVLLALVLAVVIPASFLRGWHGAWTYGPRYILPILPFAWLGVGLALEACWPQNWIRWGASGLAALGLLVQLPAALVDHTTQTDLALQAARVAWPDDGVTDAVEQEAVRFERLLWDWRFAAPWAHWRILRHRSADLGEAFASRAIYFVDGDTPLVPQHERERGFRHLAWVDLPTRLGGSVWPAVLLCVVLGGVGLILGLRAVDPAAV